tara:strand:- start:19 stop:171 length:153 start_codon:yes stop_codon:yes gene_type:complete
VGKEVSLWDTPPTPKVFIMNEFGLLMALLDTAAAVVTAASVFSIALRMKK